MARSPDLVAHLFREEAGRIVSRLTRVLGGRHLDLAEDAVQEALMRALQGWPLHGVPDQPAAWLFTVARRLAIDALRRDTWFRERETAITAALEALHRDAVDEGRLPFGDADLCLMFLTCHPALSQEVRVALTLKTVCGFGVDEIARAFLQPKATVAQRLVRAKRTLRDRDVAVDLPGPAALAERRAAVLEALYLMFNEGYATHDGASLTRPDVCLEATRLTRHLATTPPLAAPPVFALLALMLVHAARLAARTTVEGDLVLLDAQDRTRWDGALLSEGLAWFSRSITGPEETAYHLQAAIVITHAAAEGRQTDWPRILGLYDRLLALTPSPVVALNRAVAVWRVAGASAALDALARDGITALLPAYHLAHAVEGSLLAALGRRDEARAAFDRALACSCSAPERRLLLERRDSLAAP